MAGFSLEIKKEITKITCKITEVTNSKIISWINNINGRQIKVINKITFYKKESKKLAIRE